MKVILKQFLFLLFDLAEKQQQQQQANIDSSYTSSVNTRVLPAKNDNATTKGEKKRQLLCS